MKKSKVTNHVIFGVLIVLSLIFIYPLIVVLYNSFKGDFVILKDPFAFPNSDTFVGIANYIKGVSQSGFLRAIMLSFFITISSVIVIVLLTSMAAWFIIRVKSKFNQIIYYCFVFSMIVPFQMVMYSMVSLSSWMFLDNPIGIILLYAGFGAGLSVFMFSGFVKGIPREIEEAAAIDGCSPLQTYFKVVMPMLKPTVITVAILNAMWVWNDYLLPNLVLGAGENKTIPVAIQQALVGSYGKVDWGAFMAMMVLAIVPIVIFYIACQKYIIKGVIAGAVKG